MGSNFEQIAPGSVALHESLTGQFFKVAANRVQIQFNVPVVDFFRAVESAHVPTQGVPPSSPRAAAATRTLDLVPQRVQFHDVELCRVLAVQACEIGRDTVVLEFEQQFLKRHVAGDFHVDAPWRHCIVAAATKTAREQ